jgi:hypothetical protein
VLLSRAVQAAHIQWQEPELPGTQTNMDYRISAGEAIALSFADADG